MAEDDRPPQINMSSIKVAGVGGLGMVAMVFLMAFALPEVRLFALVSGTAGAIAGAALIGYRRWVKPEPPHGPTLMVDVTTRTKEKRRQPRSGTRVELSRGRLQSSSATISTSRT
jgi:hypothetical protein